MNQILIIIGNKKETNLFVVNNAHSEMVKVESIKNSDARKREKDLVSDSPGRVVKGNGLGSRSTGIENGAVEHSLEQYADNILECVEKNRTQENNSKILLISEPGFLGLLKKHFKTANITISKTISKELIHLDEKNIFSKIKEDIKYI
jgi:protein required for attachment to host cells